MTVTRDQMWRAVRRLRPEMTRAEFDVLAERIYMKRVARERRP
jgi:hypothetical protein